MSDTSNFSRRNFLRATGMVAGAAALGSAVLPVAAQAQHGEHPADSAKTPNRGRMFFTNALQFQTLSAACERIFPKDELGPGAIDLAVPYFIDNQLAGAWGVNAREYMDGPHFEGAPTQGWQTPLNRQDLFLQGLAALNAGARADFKADFPKLSGEQQDQILKKCEAGELPTEGFTSSFFFTQLKNAVLAGAYADPIYNGNNNMDGWRMKQYPGAQMMYTQVIGNDGFDPIDPMSLADMQ